MITRAAEKIGYERARTRVGQALLMNGVDHVEPHTAIPALIDKLSAIADQRARHSTLPAYVAAVRAAVESSRPDLDTVVGELRGGTDYANLLPGVLSARVYLKQQNAHVQTLLESYAEPLSVFASLAPRASEREPVNPIEGEPFPGPPKRAANLEREPPNPVEREPFPGPPKRAANLEREPSNPVEREPFRRAEPFRYPAGELRYAWKTLLQNHPHDSICGCSIDAVHEENMTRFARARQVASALVDSALEAIADTIPAPPDDTLRLVVVNPDASERAQVVEAFIDLPIDSAEPWRHVDPQALDRPVTFWPQHITISEVRSSSGRLVPFHVLGEEVLVHHEMSRYETPWALNVRRIHIAWWAPLLPPCGYAAFDLQIGDAKTAPQVVQTFKSARFAGSAGSAGLKARATDDVRAENEHLALSVNGDGTFEVTDKKTGTTYHRVACLEDVGDVGDEYNYCPPAADRRVTNADARVTRVSTVANGLVRTTLRVELELPLLRAAAADRQSRTSETVTVPVTIDATLDAGSPRVAFAVSLDNRASDHRLRVLFPTGAANVETARADTAFDVVSRPARQPVPAMIRNEAPVSNAPMISLVDAGDSLAGATVIGKGLMEYEIVGDEPAIALTLIRAVGDLSRNDLATRPSGQAGPPVATPAAQCLGRHRFEMAFEPRGAPPCAGTLLASARAHNIPPRVVVARGRGGQAPLERAFVRIDRRHGDVVLSALKQAEDRPTIIVRLFNPGDEPADAVVSFDPHVARGYTVNFLEERQAELPMTAGAVSLRLRPRQIQTIEVAAD
jgi:alpha-mannosidase